MRRFALGITLSVAASLVVLLGGSHPAQAAFNQNNLMDARQFDNVNSMNQAAIQSFLSEFPSSCLKDYQTPQIVDYFNYNDGTSLNGTQHNQFRALVQVPASQAIYTAAQAWGLNPQVILTTLEKEEGLVTGGAGCASWRYNTAMGYACPDSGSCPTNPWEAGFSRQVMLASWQLRFNEQRSIGNLSWDGDGSVVYSGYMTSGTFARVSGGSTAFYDGTATIDATTVTMSNGPTASLYSYTPHFHGNQVFDSLFEQWFGNVFAYAYGVPAASSAYASAACNIPSFASPQVGRLYNPDMQDYLFTTSQQEACADVRFGYIWDGIAFTSAPSTAQPVYRLADLGHHLFTTSTAVVSDYTTNQGYHSEGTAFYAYTSSTVPGTTPVYWLQNDSTALITASGGEAAYYQTQSFQNAGAGFYVPVSDSHTSIFRLQSAGDRLYTIDSTEKQYASQHGYTLENQSLNADTAGTRTDIPVYRLIGPGGHFYTENPHERDIAVIRYGFFSEGVGFYSPTPSSSVSPVFRLTDYATGRRLYSSSTAEVSAAGSLYHYTFEGPAFYTY